MVICRCITGQRGNKSIIANATFTALLYTLDFRLKTNKNGQIEQNRTAEG